MDTASPSKRGAIRFGVFEVDVRAGELRKQGVKIKLQEQPFQVLQILLEHPGETVTREDLRQRIWPADTFVDFDGGVNNAIKRLREALGDKAETPRYIETLPRRGYRFIGTVNGSASLTPVDGSGTIAEFSSATLRPSSRNLRLGILVGVVSTALLVMLGFMPTKWWARLRGRGDVSQIRSIAVLPLQNLSGDPTQEYFADAMTEELITELSRIRALKVISRTSVMRFKKTDKPLAQIARELGVDGIVEGSVLRSGDRLRITAQLIYAPKDTNLWAQTYDRNLRDTLTLQSEVAAAIAGEIRTQLTPEEQARLHTSRPITFRALDAYLQGTYHLNKKGRGSGDEEKAKAARYFQGAIAEDPGFAPAYVALARTHEALLLPSTEDHDAMKIALEKALLLDPGSSEAHTLLGVVRCDEWNWSAAEEEYRRGVELNPNSADARLYLAWFLEGTGRLSEALKEYQRAQELDPEEDHLSEGLAAQGKYDQAIELERLALQSHPDDGYLHYELGDMYARKGDYKGWVQEQQRSVILFGSPELAAPLGDAFAKAGYRGAMQVLAADLERFQAEGRIYMPLRLAEVYTALRNEERAFYWLENAYDHYRQGYSDSADGGMMWLKGDHWFAPLRSDKRFNDLLRRVGLPQ